MKGTYNRLFEKVAPRMSDEELLNSVLSGGKGYNMENSKNTSKKRRAKAPMIAVIAAAAAVMTTAGAVAVYNRNINEEYNNALTQDAALFQQKYTDIDGNTLDMKDIAQKSGIYEKLNVELNKTFKCEDFTFEVPGAISDGEELYIMYNVVFDEDPWSGTNPWFKENENVFLDGTTNCYEVKRSGRLCKGTVSEREGKTVYSSYYALTGIENCTDTLKVSFDCLWGSSMMSGEHYFDAEVEIPPISDDLTKYNKTVDIPDAPYVMLARWGNWDLTQVEVTPLGVAFKMETDGATPDPSVCKFYSPEIPIFVTFKDGTTLELGHPYAGFGIDTKDKTLRIKILFNYPVDVDDIQSIQFASAAVDMNGSVTVVDIPEIPMEEDWRLDRTPQK